jgi:hypothetical protein
MEIADDHSSLLNVQHNLAILYYAEARYEESDKIYRAVLQKRSQFSG